MIAHESFMTVWNDTDRLPSFDELKSYGLSYEIENNNDIHKSFLRLTGTKGDLECFLVVNQIDEDENNYWD